MINYHIPRPASTLQGWQKIFVSQCDEAAWVLSAKTLAEHVEELPHAFTELKFALSVTAFIENAPITCLDTALPFGGPVTLREVAMMALIDAQLVVFRESLGIDWAKSIHALHAAILLRPRTLNAERKLLAALCALAQALGKLEREHSPQNGEVADDPQVASDSMDFLVRYFPAGYHPAALIWLMEEARKQGMSEVFLKGCLRAIFLNAYWPSWRACAPLRDDEDGTIRTLARELLTSEEITGGAHAHLAVFASWELFPEHGVRPPEDDVEY